MSQYLVYSFPMITIVAIFYFFWYYWSIRRTPSGAKSPLDWIARRQRRDAVPRRRFTFAGTLHPMGRKDALPLLLITVIYAVTAFLNLGSATAPQSFASFEGHQTVEVALEEEVSLTALQYYPGLGTGSYRLEISSDGERWLTLWARKDDDGKVTSYYWADGAGFDPSYAVSQKYNELFKWLNIQPENPQNARYLRITGKADKNLLELGELALYDQDGALVPPADSALFDEQSTVPAKSTWFNSTYFDEIYHARTAYEHIEGVSPYEVSHPPLGKLILGLGIQLFGMVPLGWRFMGTLFGVLMLPILYLFLKNLFGKTVVAACGTILLAADFMHLTQTRIATIDTYGVFFILLMYYFLYRWLTLPAGSSFKKGALPLLLSGLCWGLGAASKWTVIYGCVGLVVLYFIGLWQKLRDWPQTEGAPPPGLFLAKTLLFSVLCFAVIPAVIYTLAYYPYALAKGDTSLKGLCSVMWENQKYMFSYHKGVTDTHPYSSRWYQWLVDARPILYYLDTATPGVKTAFGAFVNPVLCWGGLLAMAAVGVRMVTARCGKALFILVGYLSQLVPWLLIGRITFEYHYFPSVIFLVLALAYVFNQLMECRRANWRPAVYGMTGGAVALYALFYPVLTGVTIPIFYSDNFLKWLPSWPF